MNTAEHRSGLDERYIVVRHLKLQRLEPKAVGSLIAEIDALIGIDRISVNTKTSSIDVAYDASASDHLLTDIENVLRRHGCNISQSRWTRFKKSWYRFSDKNIYDNAKHEAACCNKPPPGK